MAAHGRGVIASATVKPHETVPHHNGAHREGFTRMKPRMGRTWGTIVEASRVDVDIKTPLPFLPSNAAGAARTMRSMSSGRGGLSAGANQRMPNSNSSTPTAASRGRHINAAPSPVALFGTTAPRMPALSTKASPRESRSLTRGTGVSTHTQDVPLLSAAPAAIAVGSSGDPSSERVHEESPLPSSLDHSMSTLTSSSSDERQELRSQDGNAGEAEGPVTQGPRDLPPHLEYTPLDNDSVMVALSHGKALKEYQPFFKGAGKVIDVLEGESLSESVWRMHGAWEPSDGKEYDPLLDYGAVDSILPGRTTEESDILRDVIIRYEQEHLNFVWMSLSDAIASISQHDPTQLRLQRADVHIRNYLRHIKALCTEKDPEHLSSVDSTISEVREAYGAVHPLKDLYRLLARRDYGDRALVVDPEAYRIAMMSVAEVEDMHPHPYKPRVKFKRPADSPSPQTLLVPVSAAPAAAPGTYMGPLPGVRFVETPSMLGHSSAISALPGAGRIKDTWSVSQASAIGGPSVMRTANQWGGGQPLWEAGDGPSPPNGTNTHTTGFPPLGGQGSGGGGNAGGGGGGGGGNRYLGMSGAIGGGGGGGGGGRDPGPMAAPGQNPGGAD
ncbi:hypothetical protein DFH07DRAFT_785603, partial [Mycena maculata]